MPETKTARHPTRIYYNQDRTAFLLRTDGNETMVPLFDARSEHRVPGPVRDALANEMIAQLLLRNFTMDQIIAGDGVMDRTLPVVKIKSNTPKSLPRIRQAIANVRAMELLRAVPAPRPKTAKETCQAEAEMWVREQPEAIIEALAPLEAVVIEIAKLRGGAQMTTEEALAAVHARIGDDTNTDCALSDAA
jgi:hypothetical protein